MPNAEVANDAKGHSNLNRPLSADLSPSESAASSTRCQLTSSRMADDGEGAPVLTMEGVVREKRRSGSGPAKALATYLEKPNSERLG